MTRIPTRKAVLLRSDVNREPFIQRVHERLGFERAIVALYDRIIGMTGDPELNQRLHVFRREEKLHEEVLEALLRQLGRDPSDAPSLEILSQEGSLDRLLTALCEAEMLDQGGWELLVELGKAADLDREWLSTFRMALRQEKQHLHVVREALLRRDVAQLEEQTLAG
jgi:rubrerythrin